MKTQYEEAYNRALKWIEQYTIDEKGIAVNSDEEIPYPEVTGYYIPTLLKWNEKDRAVQYAKWLCSIQHKSGAWGDPNKDEEYTFDSAQVLKGLVAIYPIMPEIKQNIISGCDWLLSQIQGNGRMITPNQSAWGNEKICSELVHLYCISPLYEAANLFGKAVYREQGEKVVEYYLKEYYERITTFQMLSHFQAYVVEGLIDVGKSEVARVGLNNLETYSNRQGVIPAYNNVKWMCSTGMFQLALSYMKLGEMKKGEELFSLVCARQNETGGWYGSYPTNFQNRLGIGKERMTYFPKSEISWAVKYFLDALYLIENN